MLVLISLYLRVLGKRADKGLEAAF
jgi:hypothetical protein